MNNDKYVYIVGYKDPTKGYIGYAGTKELALSYTCQRKGTKYKKVKYSDVKDYLNNEILIPITTYDNDNDIVMSEDEEQWFLESFETYIQDLLYMMDKWKTMLNILKFNDDEIPYINHLVDIFRQYKKYFDVPWDQDYYEIFDMKKVYIWFIENVIGDKMK